MAPVVLMPADDPFDTGWKIHAALTDWTGKVDTKASFALTIESAILGGVVALSAENRPLSGLSGAALWISRGGIAVLALAILCAVAVVRPRLRSRTLKAESREHFIYFGHLRHLDAQDIERHLRATPLLPVLAHQLDVMSTIAWRKHRYVQASMTLTPLGVALLLVAGLLG